MQKNLYNKKHIIIFFLIIFSLFFALFIPSLARHRNRTEIITVKVWDGAIADAYKSGSGLESDPYIISDGSEFAYFKENLKETDYEGVFFKITNDIYLNEGIFLKDDGFKYLIDDEEYFIKNYTRQYFDTNEFDNLKGTIQRFDSIEKFKGNLNGDFHKIFGLYIFDESNNVGLFKTLQGEVENLYIENSLVYGGVNTATIVASGEGFKIKNVFASSITSGIDTEVIQEEIIEIKDQVFNVANFELVDILDIENNFLYNASDIKSISLSGKYKINNPANSVEINLGGEDLLSDEFSINISTYKDELDLTIDSLNQLETVTFYDLVINLEYESYIAGGLVGCGKDFLIENALYKGSVESKSIAGGLVGLSTESFNIKNSYNNAVIMGITTSGILGVAEGITNESVITNSYDYTTSETETYAGVINSVFTSRENILIQNVINFTAAYFINSIDSSLVSVNDSYNTRENTVASGTILGSILEEDTSEIISLMGDISYLEFTDFDSIIENNVWVYEEADPPILFLDDEKNKDVFLHAGVYSWNNFSHDLDEKEFSSAIVLSVSMKEINNISKIEYFISEDVLSISDLDLVDEFLTYDADIKLSSDGDYIIYLKITSYDNSVYYINSDVLSLLKENLVSLEAGELFYDSFSRRADKVFINEDMSILVNNEKELEAYYFISGEKLTVKDLNKISKSRWISLEDEIKINNRGSNIVYVRSFYNNKWVYINTDEIIFDGYGLMYPSKNTITNKSNFDILVNLSIASKLDEYIVSNIKLPDDTVFTLYDLKTNKTYTMLLEGENYTLKEGLYYYALSSFPEAGNVIKTLEGHNESKSYKLNVDFAKADIKTTIEDVLIYFEGEGDEVLISTLESDKKYLTITSSIKNSLVLYSDFEDEINLNSNSINDIDLNVLYRAEDVIDTTFSNKYVGIELEILNNALNKDDLKNIEFFVGEKKYNFDSSTKVRITLDSSVKNLNETLSVITKEGNIFTKSGNYTLKVKLFTSTNSHYADEYFNHINIPLIMRNSNKQNKHGFKLILDESSSILFKNIENDIDYNISALVTGEFVNPSISVSLYKKDSLSAYDQKYNKLDLAEFITNSLVNKLDTDYFLFNPVIIYNGSNLNSKTLVFKKNKLQYNSYKLVFELFDGEKFIESQERIFIVR